jgi:hypothetical protein
MTTTTGRRRTTTGRRRMEERFIREGAIVALIFLSGGSLEISLEMSLLPNTT